MSEIMGFIFEDGLKFPRQIYSVVKACFFQLRLLSKAKPFLPFKDFEKVIHAFILSKLDNSNCSMCVFTNHYFVISLAMTIFGVPAAMTIFGVPAAMLSWRTLLLPSLHETSQR